MKTIKSLLSLTVLIIAAILSSCNKNNVDISVIASSTGLTEDEISSLK
jgi:hypothetical protein